MIKSFRHKGIQAFFENGSKAGIQAHHVDRLRRQLLALNHATSPECINVPGWRLHSLNGYNPKGQSLKKHWSIAVNAGWRLTFTFENENVHLVDYQDYH